LQFVWLRQINFQGLTGLFDVLEHLPVRRDMVADNRIVSVYGKMDLYVENNPKAFAVIKNSPKIQ